MKNRPTIDQYLISMCLLTIDRFNERYRTFSTEALKNIADEEYNSVDITARLGSQFCEMVHYVSFSKSNKKSSPIKNGLFVKSKDFKIKIQYLKNLDFSNGIKSDSKSWASIQDGFDWIFEEIRNGNGGRCAFVIGWFNCVDSFSQIAQIGESRGSKPLYDCERVRYFPFLKADGEHTKDLRCDYDSAYCSFPVDEHTNCMFIGNEDDTFHFAVYY